MNIGLLGAANSIHTIKIANGLADLGHCVTLFTLPNHKDIDRALDRRVELIYLKYGGGKGYVLNCGCLKKWLAGNHIDILNVHYASGYGTLASLVGFQPYILSVWGSDVYEFPEKSFVHRWLIKRNLSKATAIFSTSHVMAERTKRYAPDKPITVTPFGIDTEAFSPVDKPADKKGCVTIGIVKLISPKYGVRELICAFDRVVRDMPDKDIRLSIYGDGPQRKEMEQLSEKLGQNSRIVFYGRISHSKVPDALHTMDIFCAPSLSESFGVAAVEAMACGIPCVTSDAEGFTEVMADGETGFIVPRKNIDMLTQKLGTLINDEALRVKMGEAGRSRAVRLYSWENNIRTIADALIKAGDRV